MLLAPDKRHLRSSFLCYPVASGGFGLAASENGIRCFTPVDAHNILGNGSNKKKQKQDGEKNKIYTRWQLENKK